MKKYELTTESINIGETKFFRIKAIKSFGKVNAGYLGGYIEKEDNLSHDGNAWVDANAQVSGNAWVSGNVRVSGNARVTGNACLNGNACVDGNAWVSGNADYTTIKGFGREYSDTTFFKQKDGTIGVVCGCFYGALDEFRTKVKETHKDSKFAKEYLMIADLMEMHFEGSEGE